jgi:lipopolysaccharide export system protein LptA
MQEIRSSSTVRLLLTAFLVLIIGLCGQAVYAQKKAKVTLKKADQIRGGGGKKKEKFDRVIGNVTFVQNTTTIDCDSAHFYKKRNSIEAYGHVHIIDGDSVDITGSRLEYDGNTKKAKLRNNVVFTKLATAKLYTDFLDFSRPTNVAYYFNGGKLVDSINVLTSRKGYYNLNSNLASFKTNVNVKNPDYTMTADSLQYNSRTKLIYFVTETTVINKDSSTFVYKGGIYNTRSKVSDVKEGIGESKEYTIIGDKYDFDGIRNIGKVRGNVVMTSKKENLLIYGQASDYFKNTGVSKVYNHAYLAKVTEDNDTLFMSADTLISIDNDDPKKKRLLAYNNVRIFKSDMQGTADSLEYRPSDSTLYFYKNPVLWTQGNQMTADSIRMLLEHNTISKIFLVANAFVISQDTLLNFNQIKGRKMTAELANRKINRVFVMGNGESLYYILDDKNTAMRGMNKIICSDITIRFKQGKVNNLSFYKKPDGNFIPPHELKKEDRTLKGFDWKEDQKPGKEDVVQTYDPSVEPVNPLPKENKNPGKSKTKKAVQ